MSPHHHFVSKITTTNPSTVIKKLTSQPSTHRNTANMPMKLQTAPSAPPAAPAAAEMSDGDVSAAESDRSNSSRENRGAAGGGPGGGGGGGGGGGDTSDEEADSDDSSEMDEGECESRRTQLLQHVQDLEGQFGLLREQLYRERMAQVLWELGVVNFDKCRLFRKSAVND